MIIDESNIGEFIEQKTLDCSDKGITCIKYIPNYITEIFCDRNRLTSLPKLPYGLRVLYCPYNKLTELPELPDTLIDLYCYTNKLTSIPKIPENITGINCVDNNLLPMGDSYGIPYDINVENFKEHNKIIKRKSILKCLLNKI